MSGRYPPALILVRHADAGDRARYRGDDDLLRPLSVLGHRQAREIAERVGKLPVSSLLSSSATRCVETVEPLAALTHHEIEILPELIEGETGDQALQLLLGRHPAATSVIVACSHGDVLGLIIDALLQRGLEHSGRPRLPKGAIVEIALSDSGEAEHLRFRGAP